MTAARWFAPSLLATALLILVPAGGAAAQGAEPAATTKPSPSPDEMAQALLSLEPHPQRAADLALYGQFIGAWDVEVTLYPPGAPPVRQRGEWLFSWALEGRAVQDVWIVPARAERTRVARGPQPYGTTLRFPDASGQRWRIVWINPVSHSVLTMTARQHEGEIVQEGVDDDAQRFRWVFHAIEPTRFRWRAEDTTDGRTWTLRQAMLVTRRSRPPSQPPGAGR